MESMDLLFTLRRYGWEPYGASMRKHGDTVYIMARKDGRDAFLTAGQDDPLFIGTRWAGNAFKLCELTRENCEALRERFPFTAPVSLHGKAVTIGLGDRLGLCTGAHIAALRGTEVFPVLGQQSARELLSTGRTNRDMMDATAWQVFCTGYEGGYSVDGDHRKTLAEILEAIRDGVTMITLDCSDYIETTAYDLPSAEAKRRCAQAFPSELLQLWEERYCEKTFPIGETQSTVIRREDFWQMLLTYGRAVLFAGDVYKKAVLPCGRPISFELSIDETKTPTEACAHYFIAAELRRLGVTADSIAPRFCGEFQKGIDYIGDVEQFREQFRAHAAVADHFGHRISVHSGSDKFRVFPCISEESGKRFHIKTSGTSWVEAVRVVAACDPGLFRRMLQYACEHFEEARRYYHIGAKLSSVPAPESVPVRALPGLMDDTDVRQVMHITYGVLLQAKTANGTPLFRDGIYRVLRDHREELCDTIRRHIRRHLLSLSVAEQEWTP